MIKFPIPARWKSMFLPTGYISFQFIYIFLTVIQCSVQTHTWPSNKFPGFIDIWAELLLETLWLACVPLFIVNVDTWSGLWERRWVFLQTPQFLFNVCPTLACRLLFTHLGHCGHGGNSSCCKSDAFAARTQETGRRRQPLPTLTCVCIEGWEGFPEPEHDVHLKQPVGDHTEDEEERRTAKQEPDGKEDIRICRYTWDTKTQNIDKIGNHPNHTRFCIVCLCLFFFPIYIHIYLYIKIAGIH